MNEPRLTRHASTEAVNNVLTTLLKELNYKLVKKIELV